ncbi:MAG: helix-turn-helix transcriptional regulator [Candidatus Sericytochromatia bacterium]|nr:helix-turn-helix transcriptional regulator [Candidatus Sericytochromatia bacterium]
MEKKNEASKKEFGERLKKIRNEGSLSQEQLGKTLGYKNPRSDISNLENGRKYPSVDKLIKLAESLPVSIDYLLLGKKVTWIKSYEDSENLENN